MDGSGSAYLAGMTASDDFLLLNPYQAARAGGTGDAFVAKLNSTGTAFSGWWVVYIPSGSSSSSARFALAAPSALREPSGWQGGERSSGRVPRSCCLP